MKKPRDIGKSIYKPGTLGSSGYPGLANTAHLIAEYIPKCKIFVEVFAGMGRVAPHVKADQYVFNDMSDYAIEKLKGKYPNHTVIKGDFMDCIKKYDAPGTFLFMDPPWSKGIYEENNKTFCDRTAVKYYEDILEVAPTLKSDWFLCSDVKEKEIKKIMSKSGYPIKDIMSRKKLMGGYIGTKVLANKEFIRYNQADLFSF